MKQFQGFSPQTYDFLIRLAFNNNKQWFEEHRAEYKEFVQKPALLMERELSEAALKIDPRFRVGRYALSRINRDTRFSKNKAPYRDHFWIGYRHPEMRNSECFGLFFDLHPGSYGYGMGLYCPQKEFMDAFRTKALARPAELLRIVTEPELTALLELGGQDYRRTLPGFEDLPEELQPYIQKRFFYLERQNSDIEHTYRRELLHEVIHAFELMAPLYHFAQN